MDGVIQEARDFLTQNWSATTDLVAWKERVVSQHWAALRWPLDCLGRGLDEDTAQQVEALFREVNAPGPGQDKSNLWAGTVVGFGSPELKQKFIQPLLMDELAMCLLYSEPGAGSDLAGIRTTAILDGDEWVVNGQKVWTSGARDADYGMLVARTDWDQPKHRGITFFFLPMKQPGVEVRPLRQATGDSRFNEVFITNARIPAGNMLGELNAGWWVLQSALAYERAAMGISRKGPPSAGGGRTAAAMGQIPAPDLSLVSLAQEMGRSKDAHIRQQLSRLYCMRKVNDWNNDRSRAMSAGDASSSIASFCKLAMSGLLHFAGHLHAEILGAEGTLDGEQNPRARDANYSHLNAYFTSIGGGTDQIQRNIIGERILGLPKEPELDRYAPFRDVPVSTAPR
jgi:alkylation response protein AidB-like acyl-CoA dehydrogenase